MVQAPQRTAASGPTLVRLLKRVTQADVSEPGQSLADRLSEWLGWADAITLSSALNAGGSATQVGAQGGARPAPVCAHPDARPEAQAACERVHASLTRAIAATARAPSAQTRAHAVSADAQAAEVLPDYADFRQRYQSMQQTMENDIGELRQRLRVMLAAATPGMARLATVDAVMERSLGGRERSLLASVPGLLGVHFGRLRDAHRDAQRDAQAAAEANADAPAAPPSRAWLRTFLDDMHSVLLAELEVRFQPVEGLLAALRTR